MEFKPVMLRPLLLLIAFLSPSLIFSQQKEDPAKMIREVINVEVERAKFAPPPPPPTQTTTTDKKGKKKKVEEPPPPPEEAAPDTANPFMPAPISEVTKRAQAWYKSEHKKFKKSNGANSGNNVTCTVTFPFKQKILNPENAVDGKILMDVVIEAKEGKFRYTVKNIRHVADKAGMSGGDIYLQVPECGSMKVNDRTWKHIRSDAFADVQVLTEDLKQKMRFGEEPAKDEW
jgi:hypothetical protein